MGDASSFNLLAREGPAADTIPGRGWYGFVNLQHTFQDLEAPVPAPIINSSGTVAFTNFVSGTAGFGGGLWSGLPGQLKALVVRDLPAAGTGSLTFRINGAPAMADNGQVAFVAQATHFPTFTPNVYGIWSGADKDSMTPVALQGQQVPDLPAGVVYTGGIGQRTFIGNGSELMWAAPGMNHATGAVGFIAVFSGTGVDSSNNLGLFVGTPGDVHLIARAGDQAPDLPAGVNYSLSPYPDTPNPKLNGSGEVAFTTTLTGAGVTTANDTAVFAGTPGQIHLAVREGDPIPGAGPGVVFGDLRPFDGPGIAINDSGDVLFQTSHFDGHDVKIDAYYVARTDGEILLLAQLGELVDLGNGNLQPIASIDVRSSAEFNYMNNLNSVFNTNGQFIFHAQIGGGEAIIIAQVPEPSCLALIGLGCLALLTRHRERSSSQVW